VSKSNILTLVSTNKIIDLAPISQLINDTIISDWTWLSPDKAVECEIKQTNQSDTFQIIKTLRPTLDSLKIDVLITPAQNRRKKLLLADMDSTIVAEETLDELAAHAGLKDKIAAITTRAMNGELDFHTALRKRIALLKDLPITALEKTLQHTTLNPGAKTFIQTMKHHNATCILISGGFTYFTNAIAQQCGFDKNYGNILDIKENRLTGITLDPILDKGSKLRQLEQETATLNITKADTITIGDGANDLPMLLAAQNNGGLGIGYRAKPAVAAQLINNIHHNTLTTALYAQGYTDKEISIIS